MFDINNAQKNDVNKLTVKAIKILSHGNTKGNNENIDNINKAGMK